MTDTTDSVEYILLFDSFIQGSNPSLGVRPQSLSIKAFAQPINSFGYSN